MNSPQRKTVLVVGASGLIGYFVATDLMQRGFAVVAAARRFTPDQWNYFGPRSRELPIANLDSAGLQALLEESKADIVVNCLGILQDDPDARAQDIHEAFVERLLAARQVASRRPLLVHLSIPGHSTDDSTEFSRTKRNAEQHIVASGLPYAILRPGFVWAPAAFGGSAMLRSLAALPIDIPAHEASRPFQAVAIEDIAQTVAWLAERDTSGRAVTWDLMHPERITVGGVVGAVRDWLGAGRTPRLPTPAFMLDWAAKAGDLSVYLGWRPPVRSTSIAEMRRGVEGDPRAWMAETDIVPRSLVAALAARPATIQEKWFARLYGLKALILASLVIFWCASGLIALTVAYDQAVAILTSHGFSDGAARAITVVSSLLDISVGIAIAFRRSCRSGLMIGVLVSLGYMVGSTIITPDLWIEPLGALVKTGPAIVLMLVALAMLDER